MRVEGNSVVGVYKVKLIGDEIIFERVEISLHKEVDEIGGINQDDEERTQVVEDINGVVNSLVISKNASDEDVQTVQLSELEKVALIRPFRVITETDRIEVIAGDDEIIG